MTLRECLEEAKREGFTHYKPRCGRAEYYIYGHLGGGMIDRKIIWRDFVSGWWRVADGAGTLLENIPKSATEIDQVIEAQAAIMAERNGDE